MKCDTIQNFYGKAIRENKNDVPAMEKAIWAIMKHYSKDADHSDCPAGADSWCSFNKDKATGGSTHRPIKNPLRPAVVETIKPLFQRLANTDFLSAVQEAYTQNPCESYNHLLWNLAPKESYTSTTETSLAVSLSVCLYNSGYYYTLSRLFEKCGIQVSDFQKLSWQNLDKQRQRTSDYKQRDEVKLRRKKTRRAKCKKQDAFLHEEGTQYKSGHFYVSEKPKTTKQKKPRRQTKTKASKPKQAKTKGKQQASSKKQTKKNITTNQKKTSKKATPSKKAALPKKNVSRKR